MEVYGNYNPKDYSEDFPSARCRRAFEQYNGSRVGQSAEEWNEIKRIFIAGWTACNPTEKEAVA